MSSFFCFLFLVWGPLDVNMRYILGFVGLFFCSGAIVGMNFNNNSESILHNNQESLCTVHEDSAEDVIDQDRYNEILKDVEEKWDKRNEEYDELVTDFEDCLACDFGSCFSIIGRMSEILEDMSDDYDDFIKQHQFWALLFYVHKYHNYKNAWCIPLDNIACPNRIAHAVIGKYSNEEQLYETINNKKKMINQITKYFYDHYKLCYE